MARLLFVIFVFLILLFFAPGIWILAMRLMRRVETAVDSDQLDVDKVRAAKKAVKYKLEEEAREMRAKTRRNNKARKDIQHV